MSSKVEIVTDSSHYLPAEVVARHGIHQVSLYVTWNGRTERETDIASYDDFYDYLRSTHDMPSTSQPSVGDFLAVYEPLLEQGSNIVSIHLSAGISGTFQAAEQARSQLVENGIDPARITVVDSGTACAPLGMMAVAAANKAQDGADVADVVDAARSVREAQKIWFAVDTLEFLRRGGRIGSAKAWLGTALKIKPILTIDQEIKPIERVRTSKRAFERLVDYLGERHAQGCETWLIQHIQADDQVERLIERGQEIYGHGPALVSEIGPVIGVHVGPGLLGISGWPKEPIGTLLDEL